MNSATGPIPSGIYFDRDGGGYFFIADTGATCGAAFLNLWGNRAAEFPQTKEAAFARLSAHQPSEPHPVAGPIPTGIYYGVDGANFYSVERGCGCGNAFYRLWRHRVAEFPRSKEAAIAAMPRWLDMKDAPRNATEVVLRIPQKGWPGFYAQIAHWAETDGSEQPRAKGWFKATAWGFTEVEAEPTGWTWASLPVRQP